jgi:hypothetical protein
MKIIFSRKGFDSSAGGVASPIFPSGRFYSLPIPEPMPDPSYSFQYDNIENDGYNLGRLVSDLTSNKINSKMRLHLDPDLDADIIPRDKGWRPLFGQVAAAQTHLQNQEVDKGDIFIFYGWFRRIKFISGQYQYIRMEPDLHVIFGWLQIEDIYKVNDTSCVPLWASYHPHANPTRIKKYKNNTIYVSKEKIELPNQDLNLPGAGVFKKINPKLILTAPQQHKRSLWKLPSWIYPVGKASSLSYHEDHKRWVREKDYVSLETVGRGQ